MNSSSGSSLPAHVADATATAVPLPTWKEGKPPVPGIYFGHSSAPSRMNNAPSLYEFDGEVFQHYTGWYDHAITHWMETDIPLPAESNAISPNEVSTDDAGLDEPLHPTHSGGTL